MTIRNGKYFPLLTLAGALVILIGVIGCPSKEAVQLDGLKAAATTEFKVEGTLGGLGTFEWDIAPLVTHAAAALDEVGYAYAKGAITKAQGEAKVAAIDKAHDTLLAAKAACKQVGTHCTGDEAAARKLLDQGRAELENIP